MLHTYRFPLKEFQNRNLDELSVVSVGAAGSEALVKWFTSYL